MYKLILNSLSSTYTIQKIGTQISFLTDPANSDYQCFIQDVAEQGIEIVEGPDIIDPDYKTLRQQEYPSLQDQQDMQYWDQINGTTIWQDTITEIKEKYPKTITGGTTIGPVPDWVQEAADNWIFNKQLREYVIAVEKLEQENLSDEEKESVQSVINNTPQEVIDSFDS
jgi:hypothetical protein